jgi:hypothetical protein
VTRFYDIDAANERLPELREILGALRDQRAELIRLRDEVLERQQAVEATPDGGSGSGQGGGRGDDEQDAELRRIRLRMQGVIDQMQAGVLRLDSLGITLRDIESGLIDFPALVSGRQVCLCWRLGEDAVEWWHELTAGFSGRRPLAELA